MSERGFRLVSPSRLHFGLLAWGAEAPRQFGSVGLMIESPGLEVEALAAERSTAEGPLAHRASTILHHVRERLRREGIEAPPLRLNIRRAPGEHVGLGTGTQLSLAIARLALASVGETEPTVARIAGLTGRGQRSGIGLHGNLHGGLIVDGGRSSKSPYPPLLARIDVPSHWSILVVVPPLAPGIAGNIERAAFSRLPDLSSRSTDYLCRLVLLELLPAAVEGDLNGFGSTLSRIQEEVGRGFEPAQGGLFAHPRLEALTKWMRDHGLMGVGQSSWGPCLYGFIQAEDEQKQELSTALANQNDLAGTTYWTKASPIGARLIPNRPNE